MAQQPIIFIAGVAGSGKTSVGEKLSLETKIPFYDGDDFHDEANIRKMKKGLPLTDDDRLGWLTRLNNHCRSIDDRGAIIACSALKKKYRVLLSKGIESKVKWVLLHGEYQLIYERIKQRQGHFFAEELLQSQFETLEKTNEMWELSVEEPVEEIVLKIIKAYHL